MSKIERLPNGPMKIVSCGKYGGAVLAEVQIGMTVYHLTRLHEARNLGRRWVTRDGQFLNSDRARRLERKLDDREERLERERLVDAAKKAKDGGGALSTSDAGNEGTGRPSQPKEYVASVSIRLVENDESKTDGQWQTRTGGSERTVPEDHGDSAFGLLGACVNEALEAVAMNRELVMMMLADAVTEEPFEHLDLKCNDDRKQEFRRFWEAANKISGRW